MNPFVVTAAAVLVWWGAVWVKTRVDSEGFVARVIGPLIDPLRTTSLTMIGFCVTYLLVVGDTVSSTSTVQTLVSAKNQIRGLHAFLKEYLEHLPWAVLTTIIILFAFNLYFVNRTKNPRSSLRTLSVIRVILGANRWFGRVALSAMVATIMVWNGTSHLKDEVNARLELVATLDQQLEDKIIEVLQLAIAVELRKEVEKHLPFWHSEAISSFYETRRELSELKLFHKVDDNILARLEKLGLQEGQNDIDSVNQRLESLHNDRPKMPAFLSAMAEWSAGEANPLPPDASVAAAEASLKEIEVELHGLKAPSKPPKEARALETSEATQAIAAIIANPLNYGLLQGITDAAPLLGPAIEISAEIIVNAGQPFLKRAYEKVFALKREALTSAQFKSSRLWTEAKSIVEEITVTKLMAAVAPKETTINRSLSIADLINHLKEKYYYWLSRADRAERYRVGRRIDAIKMRLPAPETNAEHAELSNFIHMLSKEENRLAQEEMIKAVEQSLETSTISIPPLEHGRKSRINKILIYSKLTKIIETTRSNSTSIGNFSGRRTNTIPKPPKAK